MSTASQTPSVGGEPIHRQLAAALSEQLSEAALRCEGGEVRDLDRSQVVRVSHFDVQTAAQCQARAAADPDDFEPSIFTTSRAVALRSVRRLRPSGSVVEAVSKTMRQIRRADQRAEDGPGADLDWLGEYLTDESAAPLDVRVRIAARAVTWLTTTLTVLDAEAVSATKGWRHDIRPRWRYPGRGLTLDGRVDLAIPVSGNFTPAFVLNNLHPASLDALAYNVCLWTIGQRRTPEEVVVVELPTATQHRLNPDDLFERGVAAAVRAAEAVARRPDGPGSLARQATPFICQGCHWAQNCPAKNELDRQPIRKGGVQLTNAG